ncbi:MAG: hypothetical protein APF76_01700 [Desulfitibacter sp. BRH_c19]|nr:MAG: hypothetical protein APF76_01700 [Desulfitibacter sp. BRH_c19]
MFNTLIALQMLFVNIYTSYMCSKKKYSPLVTWTVFVIFTFIFIAFMRPIQNIIPNPGLGSGLFMITGFLYIIPLKYLYDQSIKYTILIMCSSWIYTMLTFSLSVRVGYFLQLDWMSLSVFLTQTIIYIITLPYFLKSVREKLTYILKNLDNKTIDTILGLSLLWFFLIILINYTFVAGTSFALELLIILFLVCNVTLSYKLFFSLISVNETAKILRERVKIDTLTKLRNREGLYEDTLNKIDNSISFAIIFIDLDDFKSINDSFGHVVGDCYIIEFVNTIKRTFKIDNFYRMSGDEFIIIYEGNELASFCCKIEELEFVEKKSGVAFRGLSLGYSLFPSDGNNLSDLLHVADINMYQKKKEKHYHRFPSR